MQLKTFDGNPRRYLLKTFRTSFVTEAGAPDPSVHNAVEAVAVARAILASLDADQEHFILLALNTKNRVYGFKTVHTGGTSQSIVDRRLVMSAALRLDAVKFIIVHNHPSGNSAPSAEDRHTTETLKEAGKILACPLLDHIIIGENEHFSFADAGYI